MTQGNSTDYRKNIKVGQYFYARHRSSFGVWVYDYVNDETGSASGDFVADFQTREEARKYVWKMNGWGTPQTALAR